MCWEGKWEPHTHNCQIAYCSSPSPTLPWPAWKSISPWSQYTYVLVCMCMGICSSFILFACVCLCLPILFMLSMLCLPKAPSKSCSTVRIYFSLVCVCTFTCMCLPVSLSNESLLKWCHCYRKGSCQVCISLFFSDKLNSWSLLQWTLNWLPSWQ